MAKALMALAALALAVSPVAARAATCLLSVEEDGGSLIIVDLRSETRLILPLAEKPHEIEVTKDAKRAFVTLFGVRDYDVRQGVPGMEVAVIDLVAAKRIARWRLPLFEGAQMLAPHGVKLRPRAEKELFVNAEIGAEAMAVFDAQSGDVLRTFALPSGVHNFIFDAKGETLYAFAGANGVYKLDPQTGAVLGHVELGSPVRGLAFTSNGRSLIASAKGEIVLLSPADLSVQNRVPIEGGQQVFYSIGAKNLILAPAGFANALDVIDAKRGVVLRRVPTGKTAIMVRVGPDGRAYVSNVQDEKITIVDLKTFKTEQIEGLQGPNGLAFGRCPDVLG